MEAEMDILSIVKIIIDGIVQLLVSAGLNPQETIKSLVDEHPLISQMNADVKNAMDQKFGP